MNPTTNGYRCKYRVSMLSTDQQNLGVKSFFANSRLKRTVDCVEVDRVNGADKRVANEECLFVCFVLVSFIT